MNFNEDIFEISAIADRQGLVKEADQLAVFIVRNSSSLLISKGFLKSDIKVVEKIISRDDLIVENELEIFLSVLAWLNHALIERIDFAPSLLNAFRMVYILPEDIVEAIQSNMHISNTKECYMILANAYR
jgi:hypothetical protein